MALKEQELKDRRSSTPFESTPFEPFDVSFDDPFPSGQVTPTHTFPSSLNNTTPQTAPPAVGMTPTQRYYLEVAKVHAEMHRNTSADYLEVAKEMSRVVDKMVESNNEGVNLLWKSMVKGDEMKEE